MLALARCGLSCEVLQTVSWTADSESVLADLQMTLTVALATTGTVKWGVVTMVTGTATTTMEAPQLLRLPQAQADGNQYIYQLHNTHFDQRKQANMVEGPVRFMSHDPV